LLYLSEATLITILQRVATNSGLSPQPGMFGTLSEYQFWPSWSLRGSRVYPDCLLRFTQADVIIEAKRLDDIPQQNPAQWAKELAAYFAQPGQGKRVFLFAIGGFAEHQLRDVQSLKRQWEADGFFQDCTNAFELLAQSWAGLWRIVNSVQGQGTLPSNERWIIEDIRHMLVLHSIRVTEPGWLKELPQDIDKLRPDMAPALTLFAALRSPAPETDWLEAIRTIGPLNNAAFWVFQRRIL
jgi:hypothetical protein